MDKKSLMLKSLIGTIIFIVLVIILSYIQHYNCSVGYIALMAFNFFIIYYLLNYFVDKHQARRMNKK